MTNVKGNHQKINRRDFLKITAFAGLAIGIGSTLRQQLSTDVGLQKTSETHYLMGTIVNFTVMSPDHRMGREAIRRTVAEMERLIAIFDYRNSGAVLANLNQNGTLRDVPIELLDIIQQSLSLGVLSQGAFDITVLPIIKAYQAGQTQVNHLMDLVDYRNVIVDGSQIRFAHPGMSITLDGIAKGRVVDAGVAVLKSMGFENILVEAGGDMMASSAAQNGEEWRIAVSNPRPSGEKEFMATFTVKNKAVTTSGDYLNHFSSDYSMYHIIDPRTARSPAELSSATIIAPSAAEADALSTTMMVLGVHDGLNLLRNLPDVEAFLITKDLIIYKTDHFPVS